MADAPGYGAPLMPFRLPMFTSTCYRLSMTESGTMPSLLAELCYDYYRLFYSVTLVMATWFTNGIALMLWEFPLPIKCLYSINCECACTF